MNKICESGHIGEAVDGGFIVGCNTLFEDNDAFVLIHNGDGWLTATYQEEITKEKAKEFYDSCPYRYKKLFTK